MEGLNLRVYDHREESHLSFTNLVKKRETASFVKVDDVIGRENDKNIIIGMLFDPKYNGERVSVIPIVGFGGLGKTTLAQLIFNDASLVEHFDLVKWACVPEIDNQKVVLGKVYKSLTNNDSHDLSIDQMKSGIRGCISNKKYLLVLDDIWDESRDRWLDIMSLLECGQIGSKVLVTTRSNIVAKVVGTVPSAYNLGLLTDTESWNLFERLAFKPGTEESNRTTWTQIGKEIVIVVEMFPLLLGLLEASSTLKTVSKSGGFSEKLNDQRQS